MGQLSEAWALTSTNDKKFFMEDEFFGHLLSENFIVLSCISSFRTISLHSRKDMESSGMLRNLNRA